MAESYDLYTLFREAALSVANRRFGPLTPETRIDSLGLDSVAVIEVIGTIEDETGTRLSDAELESIVTLGDLSRLVEKKAA